MMTIRIDSQEGEEDSPQVVRWDGSNESPVTVSILTPEELMTTGGELHIVHAYHSIDWWVTSIDELTARLIQLSEDFSSDNDRYMGQVTSDTQVVTNGWCEKLVDEKNEEIGRQTIGGMAADENPIVQRRKAQAKLTSSSSSSNAAASSAIITSSISPLSPSDYAIELAFLRRSGVASSSSSASSSASTSTSLVTPTLVYAKGRPRQVMVRLSVLHYCFGNSTLCEVLPLLKDGLSRQSLVLSRQCSSLTSSNGGGSSSETLLVQALHFQPPHIYLSHALTLTSATLVPSSMMYDVHKFDGSQQQQSTCLERFPRPSSEDDPDLKHPSLCLSSIETCLTSQRQRLHMIWNLPFDTPCFTWNCSQVLKGRQMMTFLEDPTQFIIQPRLYNIHEALTRGGASESQIGGEVTLVRGRYAYYHYLQDRCQDAGWGCAYRTLQTICSWFLLQGFVHAYVPTTITAAAAGDATNSSASTQSKTPLMPPIPSIRDIQEILVASGDKDRRFIGSKEWIGSMEVGIILRWCYGIVTKTLFISSGSEVGSHARQLREHFRLEGTPIMIGGGVLAYGLLGIDYNESTGEVRYLILDPHYTGPDTIPSILKGGWVGWKKSDLFLAEHYYNFALPQRPKDAI